MAETDTIIKELFSSRWSGHTAYHTMVDDGFLVDSKRYQLEGSNECKGKKLTLLWQMFMKSMEPGLEGWQVVFGCHQWAFKAKWPLTLLGPLSGRCRSLLDALSAAYNGYIK